MLAYYLLRVNNVGTMGLGSLYLASACTQATIGSVMTPLGTDVIASSEASATYLCTFRVLHPRLSMDIHNIAPTACAGTSMTASQYRVTGYCALIVIFINILEAFHLHDMAASRDCLVDDSIALDGFKVLHDIAVDAVLRMAAWKPDIMKQMFAFPTIFATSSFLASMATRFVLTLTGLFTSEDLVHSLGMTPCLASVSTA